MLYGISRNANFYAPFIKDVKARIGNFTDSFVRGTTGFQKNLAGSLDTVAINAPRFNEQNGLFVENTRTNLQKYSYEITAAGGRYTQNGVGSANINAGTAPDGTNTLCALTDADAAANADWDTPSPASVTGGDKVSISFFIVKDSNRDGSSITKSYSGLLIQTQSKLNRQVIDHNAGRIIKASIAPSTFDIDEARVIDYSATLWRIEIMLTVPAGGATTIKARPAPAQYFGPWGGETNTGAEQGTTTYWNLQIEKAPYPSSPIKTQATAVARNADQLTMLNTSGINYKDITVLLEAYFIGTPSAYTGNELIILQGNGTGNLILALDSAYSFTASGGGGTMDINYSDLSRETSHKIAISLAQEGANSRARVYVGGVSKLNSTQAQTLLHSETSFNIGWGSAGASGVIIKHCVVYPKALPPAFMARYTRG